MSQGGRVRVRITGFGPFGADVELPDGRPGTIQGLRQAGAVAVGSVVDATIVRVAGSGKVMLSLDSAAPLASPAPAGAPLEGSSAPAPHGGTSAAAASLVSPSAGAAAPGSHRPAGGPDGRVAAPPRGSAVPQGRTSLRVHRTDARLVLAPPPPGALPPFTAEVHASLHALMRSIDAGRAALAERCWERAVTATSVRDRVAALRAFVTQVSSQVTAAAGSGKIGQRARDRAREEAGGAPAVAMVDAHWTAKSDAWTADGPSGSVEIDPAARTALDQSREQA